MHWTLLQFGLTRVTATLISAAIGFSGGLLSSFGLYWLQGRRRKKSLRRALYTELEIPADVIQRANRQNPDSFTGPFHGDIPTTMYESQAVDLGRLPEDEMRQLISYYSTASVAKEQLQNLDDEDVAELFFENTIPILKRTREDAAEELKKDSSVSPITRNKSHTSRRGGIPHRNNTGIFIRF